MPYPEKLENLLSIQQAAEIWKLSPATIQTALYRGAFGQYARKIGKSWVILPDGMIRWKGSIAKDTPDYSHGVETTVNDFAGIETAISAYKENRISADEAIKWIASIMERLSE